MRLAHVIEQMNGLTAAIERTVCILEIWGPLHAFMRRGGADDDSLD